MTRDQRKYAGSKVPHRSGRRPYQKPGLEEEKLKFDRATLSPSVSSPDD